MQVRASDFYDLYQPSRCELRVYLKAQGLEETLPGPYAEMLRRLGERHEAQILKKFPEYANLAAYPDAIRLTQTLEAIEKKIPVLYHPLFQVRTALDGRECEIIGEPDLLTWTPAGYTIQEIKISRRVSEKDHPEILRQMELYGWLFEQTTGTVPAKLEVVMGQGESSALDYDHGKRALEIAAELTRIRSLPAEPYSPVGWSKCQGCGFRSRCWPLAEKKHDVALVADLDQGLAVALKNEGIETISVFLKRFTPETLSGFSRPWGEGMQKVGKRAQALLWNAQALESKKEILLQKPSIPRLDHYVMFDLEGIPPQLDELQKIYIWGLQVVGKTTGTFSPSVADFGPDGDRAGWTQFLSLAQSLLVAYGDIPFVHWASYEKTNIKLAERVLNLCLDLLPITKASLALPLPSYSLKVVEKYIGYKRSMQEYGGDWSMAKYIEAVETEDAAEQQALMEQILKYNQEDLEAMWGVMRWLLDK
jgi:predicted RecB family nuclease